MTSTEYAVDRERNATVRAAFPPEVAERVIAARSRRDPLGDAVVTALKQLPADRRGPLMRQAMECISAIPRGEVPAVDALLAPLRDLPDWVDFDKIDRGCRLWWRCGITNAVAMVGALGLGYSYLEGVKPLVFNGRFMEQSGRRLDETARWLLDVTVPGGLRPGGSGFDLQVRVRLIHCFVRDAMDRAEYWDEEEWAAPISQAETLLTAIAFMILPHKQLGAIGLGYTEDERDALFHLWRWITFVMGVDEDLLPTGFEDAEVTLSAKLRGSIPGDADSVAIIDALRRDALRIDPLFPTRLRPLIARTTRPALGKVLVDASFFVPWREARRHGFETAAMRTSPFRYVYPALAPLMHWRDLTRRRGWRGDEAAVAERERRRYLWYLDTLGTAEEPIRFDDVGRDRPRRGVA